LDATNFKPANIFKSTESIQSSKVFHKIDWSLPDPQSNQTLGEQTFPEKKFQICFIDHFKYGFFSVGNRSGNRLGNPW